MGVPYAEVIGDPISHSKSPLIHKFWLEKLGLEGDYRAERVAPAGLTDYVESRRHDRAWRGCNVTIPHKTAVLALAEDTTADARGAGAANTLFRRDGKLVGANTDVIALRHDVLGWAEEAALLGLPIILFGAGGAARAVLQAMRGVDEVQVVIVNRDQPKAERLLRAFGFDGHALALGAPLPPAFAVINASTLGMAGFPPLPVTGRDLGSRVYDLVYSPVETNLLKLARQADRPALDGLTMLIAQAKAAFQLFFRLAAPSGTEPELRELLTQ